MKKKMMVAVVLVVVVAVVGVVFWWRNAAGEKEDEAFLQWIRPFYQEEQDDYIFQDAQGADITQKAVSYTHLDVYKRQVILHSSLGDYE